MNMTDTIIRQVIEQLDSIVIDKQVLPNHVFNVYEGYAMILEAMDKLWDGVKDNVKCKEFLRRESLYVAARALKFAIDCT